MTREEQFKTMRETHEKMLLTKRETAKELSVSEATVDRLRVAGELQSKKVLGQIMFKLDEIARFLSE
jgi:hypothetical protein